MPRPIQELGLSQGFRNREFIINRQTQGVEHAVLKPKNAKKQLDFFYCTEPTLLDGSELHDWAQRQLYNTMGFMVLSRVENEPAIRTMIDLSIAEVTPRLIAFLKTDESKEYPVIVEQHLFDGTTGATA